MAVQLAKLDGAGSGMRLLAALRAVYSDKPLVLGQLNAAALALQPHHSDRDVIDLLNREIFQAMDREADQRIQKAAFAPPSACHPVRIPHFDAVVVLVMSVMLIRDLMAVYGLRHSLRSLFRVMTRSLFLASSTALMSTAVEFAMKAAQDRLGRRRRRHRRRGARRRPTDAGAGRGREGRDPPAASGLNYLRSTFTGEVEWLAMLIRPCDICGGGGLRGGTPMAARSRTAFTSALRRIRL